MKIDITKIQILPLAEQYLKYVAYKMVHPLKQEMVLTIGLVDGITDDLVKAKTIAIIFENLKKIFDGMTSITKYIKNE